MTLRHWPCTICTPVLESGVMNSGTTPIRIGQLSDTHFLEPGEQPEGGFGYDIDAAFDAVLDDIDQRQSQAPFDLIVVTGDVADHGRPEQYRVATDAFQRLPAPVVVTPGNHDQDAHYSSGLAPIGEAATPRIVDIENWCFLLVDSNAGIMLDDADGGRVDPDYHQRLWGNGLLGAAEADWVREASAATEAEHVFIWQHHPIGTGNGAVGPTPAFEAEWRELLGSTTKIRGIGAGHTHMPNVVDFHGCPVHVCPSLKANFDAEITTMLPPGWLTYEFQADGTFTSEVQLVDGDAWPRRSLPRSVAALLRGEISQGEFDAIVARKTAQSSSAES